MKLVNVSDVCKEVFAGGDVPKNNWVKLPTKTHNIPIYSNGEANSGLYGYTNYFRVNEPSVTVSARGTIGYTAVRMEPFVPVVRLITLVPRTEVIDLKYLCYAIRNYKFEGAGTSIPQLTVPMLKKYSFKLVGLEEQKRVVKVIDKITSMIDQRKQQLQKLDELVKTRFVEMFGDPNSNPKGYEMKKLSEIAEYWNGLTYSPEDVTLNGTVVLRSSNIQNTQLDFTDIVRVNCAITDKKYLKTNDILMCSRNGSARLVGKVALIKGLSEPMSFGAFMMIIRSKYYSYLFTLFQLPFFRKQIATSATSTINQITVKMLDDIKVPTPDSKTLNEFTLFVQQIDKSKLKMQKSLEKLKTLKKSLMQKYFG